MNRLLVLGIITIYTLSQKALCNSNLCEVVNKKSAETAIQLIKFADVYDLNILDFYCEACLDNYPKPILVNDYKIKPSLSGYSLYLNGISFNMAYLYVGGENLAQAIGCETFAVSKYLD